MLFGNQREVCTAGCRNEMPETRKQRKDGVMKKGMWKETIAVLFMVGLLAATLAGCGVEKRTERKPPQVQEETEQTEDTESFSDE